MGILVILGVILGLFVLLIAFGFIKEKRKPSRRVRGGDGHC